MEFTLTLTDLQRILEKKQARFAEALRAKTQFTTQTELGKRVGATQADISNIIHGKRKLPLGTMIEWCEILGLDCSI